MCCALLQGLKEFRTEVTGDGFFEEFEDSDVFASASPECVPADVPAMKIEGFQAVGQDGYPYRIKPAGYGLAEIALPFEPFPLH